MTPARRKPVNGRISPGDGLVLAASLVTVTFWASAFVGIRAAGQDLSPGSLAFGRLLVGTLLLGVAVAVRRVRIPRGRSLILSAAAGVVWFGAYNVALNTGELFIDAGTAAMVVGIAPALIVLAAGMFLNEGYPRRLLVGAAIALGGATLIGLAVADFSATNGVWVGVVLCLLAALAYAAGVTLEKPALADANPLAVTFVAAAVGVTVTAPFGTRLVGEIGEASASAVAWMLYLGAFPTAVAFLTWGFALARSRAGSLGSTTYLVSPIAVGMGWLLLGEAPPPLAIVGGAVSILGVIVARTARA